MEEAHVNQQESEGIIESALHEYKAGIGIFSEKMPGIAAKYNEFTQECFKKGALSEKEKQLIALGISISSQDEYCIIYHVKGCLDGGATEEEILEAVGVTAAFGGGAAMSQSVTLVLQAMEEFKQMKH
ncbi:carboxymuconolactone decarboxylase family protein [Bacillus sonorensis]|uniref:carboxymuconolactone decarboxylase family protein n=1 Tax=Bacillus TaxID=1386 RepID=UPI00055221FE|nr:MULTISPECIES: carboxymuconolactone decarboxylase family protein [Bacillus]MBG9914093.1 alkylhydroperoxidase [Bacillus sonorensis]MCF7616674.1 carboxymuconolactone decarboxylase family protein [Bacillus sonorensis]MCY7857401.1 carboxymuconolactone decarboxylase family protein [Bacillus sonorensis]MCY8026482.1 carboxymuconolactone decarboxylase family protein [Bacillus sonorensis]MCY8033722.1 carboxymuconolactone decarboxylase family protein [Bacillus sonorensis]